MHEKKILTSDGSTASLPTVGEAPWDRKLLQGRECGACACYFEQPSPDNAVQGFCRRLPAEMKVVRGLEPRIDRATGKPAMKDGQVIMQSAQVIGYIFHPTKSDGTCFDGFRPIGTLPGERAIDANLRAVSNRLKPLLNDIPEQFRPFLAVLFGINAETEN